MRERTKIPLTNGFSILNGRSVLLLYNTAMYDFQLSHQALLNIRLGLIITPTKLEAF